MNKYILQSVGHSLALSIFFDGLSTSVLKSLEATYNFADGLIRNGKFNYKQFGAEIITAQKEAAKAAYYALTPFYLRKLCKFWALGTQSTVPAFCVIILSSAFIGAYKSHTKGNSILLGALDCSLYAAADYFGFDCGLFGNLSCGAIIEGTLNLLPKLANEPNPARIQILSHNLFKDSVGGAIGSIAGSFFLEGQDWLGKVAVGSISLQVDGFGLLDKLRDGVAAAKPHHFVLCSSVFSAACILHTANTWLKNYVSPTIAFSVAVAAASIISYNIYAYAALPASVAYAVMFMELDKCVMKHFSQPSRALPQPRELEAAI